MGKTSFKTTLQEASAKPASNQTVPRGTSAAGAPRQVPLMRASHTPRAIRLAGAPGRHHHPARAKWSNLHMRPSATDDDVPSTSKALTPYRGRGPVEVWHELPPQTMYVDPWGHGHGSLQDGGLIYMDPFGHCHEKLNDGGFLYMDRQGSCHLSLDDEQAARRASSAPLPQVKSPRSHRRMALQLLDTVADGQQAVHDTDLKMLQGKSTARDKTATRTASGPNQKTRRGGTLRQPRRHN